MHQLQLNSGTRYRVENRWIADVPFIARPKTFGKKKIDGVLYYLGSKGKIYVVELFDKMFKPVKP